MKLPRSLSGRDLVKVLNRFGYEHKHQTGSHIILKHYRDGTPPIVVPDHKSIRTGTLSKIISKVSQNLGVEKKELIKQLKSKK